MKAWEIVSNGGVDALALTERASLTPGFDEVLVRVRASSINYRDLATIEDPEPRGIRYPTVPNSDCAGDVVAVGDGVIGFVPGDRVMGCFFNAWPDGDISSSIMAAALGGAVDGVLAEEVVLKASGIVRIPDTLSYEEAATLPCAGVTAWNALFGGKPIKAGETILLLGTGGVSVFAQQFANIAGAETIVTSSSDAKLRRIMELGAAQTINYKNNRDWETGVLDLTQGVGVDRVVEVGGPGTLQKSISAVRVGGHIALIGILTGAAGQITPTDIMRKSLNVRGIYVGSRQMFETMVRAIDVHALKPVIDQVVPFKNAPEAYHLMRGAQHFGKIVITC
jgi:NADPH:quinone reductase-like Zn-dependent oxidoreductase